MGRHGTIAGRKAAQDSKRAAVFTKYARLITVAAREGGGDPRLPSLVLGKFRSSTCRKITKALKILALNQYFFLAKFFLL